MHPDRKIGIAMGILLVGVVAALFFRNEPLAVEDGLSSDREQELNQKLRDRDVAVYLDTDIGDSSDLAGEEPQWTLPELFDQVRSKDAVPVPIGAQRPVEPSMAKAPDSEVKRDLGRFSPPIPSSTTAMQPRNGDRSTTNNVAAVVEALTSPESDQQRGVEEDNDYQEYTVRPGDTLSEISERLLGTQGRYREIYELNKDRIDSPDRLKVGRAIRVPRVLR